ncbi:phosphoribosyltransferase family protein [Paraburkholderia metrosideri]|uniref:Phosphoribosyltransferase family protein n=1 Tax=Paraburkholderia metrosideri TaxID=580937 RepID=A0ABW9DWM9_9BURK
MSPSDVAIDLILNTEDVIAYRAERYIEVKPGRRSPIHINFKNTLPHKPVRETLANLLSEQMEKDGITYVCGLESGGSYFASRCSDNLAAPLSLYRKDEKRHAEGGRLVGTDPKPGSKVAIVDDTLVSGRTVEPVVDYLRQFAGEIHLYTILSYGLDALIKRRLQVTKITSIAQIGCLMRAGVENGKFGLQDAEEIERFIEKQAKENGVN